jgi:hypothetical protein
MVTRYEVPNTMDSVKEHHGFYEPHESFTFRQCLGHAIGFFSSASLQSMQLPHTSPVSQLTSLSLHVVATFMVKQEQAVWWMHDDPALDSLDATVCSIWANCCAGCCRFCREIYAMNPKLRSRLYYRAYFCCFRVALCFSLPILVQLVRPSSEDVDSEEKFIDAPIHPPLVALLGPFSLLIPSFHQCMHRCVPGLVIFSWGQCLWRKKGAAMQGTWSSKKGETKVLALNFNLIIDAVYFFAQHRLIQNINFNI